MRLPNSTVTPVSAKRIIRVGRGGGGVEI
jgi:hypothetical protein